MKSYTAKTLDDVLLLASREKDCRIDELTYYITEEKSGFLGIGSQITVEVYCLKDVNEFIYNYLNTFFNNLNVEVTIEIQQTNDVFKVMLNAENNAIIIGRGGQTLQAINNVVKGAVNATFKRRFQILVDINNYKVDRYKKVKSIAYRVAKTVQRTKVDATLDPMTNDERRIVHQYLTEMKNIRTESEGEGKERRLRIFYKD